MVVEVHRKQVMLLAILLLQPVTPILISSNGDLYSLGPEGCSLTTKGYLAPGQRAMGLVRSTDVSAVQIKEKGLPKVVGYLEAGATTPKRITQLPKAAHDLIAIRDSTKMVFRVAGGRTILWNAERQTARELPLPRGAELYGDFSGNTLCMIQIERAGPNSYSCNVWLIDTAKPKLVADQVDIYLGDPGIFPTKDGFLLQSGGYLWRVGFDRKSRQLSESPTVQVLSPPMGRFRARLHPNGTVIAGDQVFDYGAKSTFDAIYWWGRGVLWTKHETGFRHLNADDEPLCPEAGEWPLLLLPRD